MTDDEIRSTYLKALSIMKLERQAPKYISEKKAWKYTIKVGIHHFNVTNQDIVYRLKKLKDNNLLTKYEELKQ